MKVNYKDFDYIIGIDPGVNTGIAIWHIREKNFFRIATVIAVIAEQIIIAANTSPACKILVRFEDARLRDWFGKSGREKLQGAGSIKRDSQRWEEFLTHHKIPFEAVEPKNNRTKMSALQFNLLTGWNGQTNSHGRDAGALVFGL